MLGFGELGRRKGAKRGISSTQYQDVCRVGAEANADGLRLDSGGAVKEITQFIERDIGTENLFVGSVNQVKDLY